MSVYKYEIITEAVKPEATRKLVSKYLSKFSLSRQLGFWKGKPEMSLKIMYLGSRQDRHIIRRIADDIRSLNHQECVLVVTTKVKIEYIGS